MLKEEKKEEAEGTPKSKNTLLEIASSSKIIKENEGVGEGNSGSKAEIEQKFKGTDLLLSSMKMMRRSFNKKKLMPISEDDVKKVVENYKHPPIPNKFMGLEFTETLQDLDKMKIFKFYCVENNFDLIKKKNRKRRQTVKNLNAVKNRKSVKV